MIRSNGVSALLRPVGGPATAGLPPVVKPSSHKQTECCLCRFATIAAAITGQSFVAAATEIFGVLKRNFLATYR
jgi:hypothetical protein